MYQVQKKNGTWVDFDPNKLTNGVLMAGAGRDEAQKIAADIDNWLPTVAVNNVVTSMALRTKVVEELKKLNPTVAAAYESYQKG